MQFLTPVAAAAFAVWRLLRSIRSGDIVMTTMGMMLAASPGAGVYFMFHEQAVTSQAAYAMKSGDSYAFQGTAGGQNLLTVSNASPACGTVAEKVGARFLASIGAVTKVSAVSGHERATIDAIVTGGSRRGCSMTLTGDTEDAARVFRQARQVHAG